MGGLGIICQCVRGVQLSWSMERTLSGYTHTHTDGIEEPRAANIAQIPSCDPRAAPSVSTVQKGLWIRMVCDRAEEETALMSRV